MDARQAQPELETGGPGNDERKIHPDLLPWDALSEADKDKDRNASASLPATLHDAGFQILRLPRGLLAAGVRHYVWRNRRYG